MSATRLNLSCGQTDIYAQARQTIGEPLPQPIYYPPFAELVEDTMRILRDMLHTDGDVLLPVGTAVYGQEGAFTTLLEPGDLCVTVNTGLFGQNLSDLVGVASGELVEIKVPHGKAVTVEQARETLRAHPDAKLFSVVHLETTTGSLNPVQEIGAMIRSEFPDVIYMVDAVSSLTSEPLRVDDWGIDICCSSSQKCINAPQGVAIVTFSERAWDAVDRRKTRIPGMCLDLYTWKKWQITMEDALAVERGENPVDGGGAVDTSITEYKVAHGPSQSYTLMQALHGSLQEIEREGLKQVIARHGAAGRALRAGVRAMGLGILADESNAASCANCVVMPGNSFPTQDYMLTMWREHGIATAGGSEHVDEMGYAGSRVGLMGFVANLDSVTALLEAMEQVLPRFDVEVKAGAAVPAARVAYEGAPVFAGA